MSRILASFGAGLLALGGAAIAPATASAAATPSVVIPADSSSTGGKLLLMLDASGSMKAMDPSGVSKMDAAKKALNTVVGGLPTDSQVGLRVYGATQPGGRPTPAACKDTQLVAPIAPLDKAGLAKAIDGFQAKGETPIAYSLGEALKDLGPSGKRSIVLVSDGEESCSPDPCPEIKKLVGSGVDLRIDTVGFAVNDKTKKQLQCVAEAGHGQYYAAADAGQLVTSVTKLSQRAMRPFSVAGKPIQGTTSPADAPHLLPGGQYLDSIPVTNGSRYYRIHRSPDTTLRLAITSRPGVNSSDMNREDWKYTLKALDGRQCASATAWRSDYAGMNDLVGASITEWAGDPGCGGVTDFALNIRRPDGGQAPVQTEIKVMQEAVASNSDALPEAVGGLPNPIRPPVAPQVKAVIGGTGFNDAQPITSGTYVADIAPGEIAFFRVPLEFGQSATFAVDGPTSAFTAWPSDYDSLYISGRVYNPARRGVRDRGPSTFRKTSAADDQVVAVPAVQYRNRSSYDSDINPVSINGDYYYAVSVGTGGVGKTVTGTVPVQFSVKVDGAKTGVPVYPPTAPVTLDPTTQVSSTASATPSATASPSATTSGTEPTSTPPSSETPTATPSATTLAAEPTGSSVPTGVVVGGGALAALAAIAAGVGLALRKSRA